MKAKPPNKLYKFHVENLRSISEGLDHIASSIRIEIALDHPDKISTYTRLYALILGAWSECRLNKVLYENDAFTETERKQILSKRSLLDKWIETVTLVFRKHYNVRSAVLSEKNIPHSAHSRFTTIITLLEKDLRYIIELRNKLAHGQWIYPLNEDGTDIAQAQMDALRNENILTLNIKRKILNDMAELIHDLAVSKGTFERDFDNRYKHLMQLRINMERKSLISWSKIIREKYIRGRRLRTA